MCTQVDLGLWITHPNLGQPNQTSNRGKNVKASINSPLYRRGQCSQSTMGMGTRWTASHQHWQQASSSRMSIFSNMDTGNYCVNVHDICVYLNPFFLHRFEINHTKTEENMHLFLRLVLWWTFPAIFNNICPKKVVHCFNGLTGTSRVHTVSVQLKK